VNRILNPRTDRFGARRRQGLSSPVFFGIVWSSVPDSNHSKVLGVQDTLVTKSDELSLCLDGRVAGVVHPTDRRGQDIPAAAEARQIRRHSEGGARMRGDAIAASEELHPNRAHHRRPAEAGPVALVIREED
jgi:hypothetical protein